MTHRLHPFSLVLLLLVGQQLPAAEPVPAANTPIVLLTREGKVDISSKGTGQWRVGQTNQALQLGDGLRTGLRSRATVRYSDFSVLRVDQLTTMEIQPPPQPGQKPLLDLKSGAAFFFSRERPTEIQFQTPVASGAIRGTEFNVEVGENGRTVVTLLDGEVLLSNAQGAVTLKSGEQGIAEQGRAPTNRVVLDAVNIIQWALYYPAVIDPDELGLADNAQNPLRDSFSAYRTGDLLGALAAHPDNAGPANDAGRIWRAALALTVGQVNEADSLLKDVQKPAPLEQALRELIAAVKQQEFAGAAQPTTASEWMARSYYLQSRSELVPALRAARQATEKSPKFGAAWIRVAELEFSFGRTERALNALDTGLALSPRNAHGLALRGFLLSARDRYAEAQDYFDRAITTDGAYGNAWLGRGLVKIRRGDRAGGRADLQVAATLEPQRSVLRSYLAKAFSNAGDRAHARKELRLARELDANDPTPWLYSALINQEQNRINEAVRELETSQDLNDNRSVYRSRLLLDQDQAVRSANLASIYRDAGMRELSAREAARSVSYDYGNYSAHQFLANSYDALRDPRLVNLRYETPWFSELLVANLLAPAGANLSQSVSQQEYSRFFDRDHIGIYSRTEYFSHGEWRQEGSQYGNIGNTSYALDGYYRTDPGARPNNDQEQLSLSAKIKQQLTPKDSIFLQALYFNTESGDVAQYYDQSRNVPGATSFDPTLRAKERQEPNLFLGYHHEWKPGVHTLALAGRLDDTFNLQGTAQPFRLTTDAGGNIVLPPFFINPRPAAALDYRSEFDAYTVELQQIYQLENHNIVAGIRYQTGESDTDSQLALPGAVPQSATTDLERFSAYAYYYWRVVKPLQLIAGVSYDNLDYPRNIDTLPPISNSQLSKDQISPKAGFYFTPLKNTTLRGIYSQSLGGLFYDTSVRLEPTQIAGFNQAFRSLIPESVVGLVPGSEFETFGLALDQDFKKTGTYLSLAGEILYSDADRVVGAYLLPPLGVPNLIPTSLHEKLDYRERVITATINQLVGKLWSFGASYRYTEGDLKDTFEELDAFDQDVSATLHQVNLHGLVNLPCGFFAGANSIWSQQSNRGYTPDIPGDDFWQHNVFAGYRFLQRRAEARVALLNLLDQDYRLNPLTLYSELPRDRTLALSLRFFF